ncbi:MAG: serine/threonine-protein kinase, partial [Myxococcota bacterium]
MRTAGASAPNRASSTAQTPTSSTRKPLSNPMPSVLDDFELLERLGGGGMAEVFKARPRAVPQRLVAIKRILPAYRNDPKFRSLLLQEARLGRSMRHPNVLRILGAGQCNGNEPYIVMEYVDGIDLKRLSWSIWASGETFHPWLAVSIASEVLSGIGHAHARVDDHGRPQPIIHRDISPENILVTRSGHVKVADFGVASHAQAANELPRGKLPYMAPELFGNSRATEQVDLFAVGVLLWELLT